MRAVAYCRYSSENQRQESIEAQLRAIEDHVKKEGLSLIEVYADEAKSATSDQRPAFQKMIKDAEKGAFDVVLVHKLDRFARDRYDSIYYRRKLKLANVALVSITEKLDGSPESVILESMLEGISEYYSRNLSRESMKGLIENALKCKTTGGKPAFGYDIDPVTKQYIINEKEAVAVKRIFSEYAEGHSYVDIIAWLSESGYVTKRGETFKPNALHSLLKNEKYIGVYIFNKSSRSKYEFGDKKEIRIEGGVPALISPETFDIVQRKLQINKTRSQVFKAKTLYLLSGKVICGECGSKMFGNRRFSKAGNEWSGYLCAGRKKKICTAKEIKKDDIEDLVLNHLEKEIFNDEFIDALSHDILKLANARQTDSLAEIKTMKEHLKKIEKKIDNVLNAIADGYASDLMRFKLKDLEVERSNLIVNIEIKEATSEKHFTREDIKKYLSQGKGIKFKNELDQMNVMDMFLEKVVVHDEYLDIHFYIDNLKKKRGYIGAPYPYAFVSTFLMNVSALQ